MVFNKNKFIIAIVCTAIGWFFGYEMGKSHLRKELRQKSQSFDIAPFLFSSPFDREQENQDNESSWWQQFVPFAKNFNGNITSNGISIFGIGSGGDFKTHEDDKFIYYEYEMDNVAKESLNVRVENNMVVIEGSEAKESFGTSISTSFHRAFPAPQNVDVDNVQMDYLDHKLIIKFPKK